MRPHALSSNLFTISLFSLSFSLSLFYSNYFCLLFFDCLVTVSPASERGRSRAGGSTSLGHSCKQNSWSFTPRVGSANHSVFVVILATEQLIIIPVRGFNQSKHFPKSILQQNSWSCHRVSSANHSISLVIPATKELIIPAHGFNQSHHLLRQNSWWPPGYPVPPRLLYHQSTAMVYCTADGFCQWKTS